MSEVYCDSSEVVGEEESPCGTSDLPSNCWRKFQNALFAILDMLDAERSAAADREKRLMSRIDQLSKTIQELSTTVQEIKPDKENPSAVADDGKKRKKKKTAKHCCASTVPVDRTRSSSTSSNGSSQEVADAARSTIQRTCRPVATPAPSCQDSEGLVALASKSDAPSNNATRDVHVPHFEESVEDDSWKTIISKQPAPKKKVLYIGNLRPDVTEDGLQTFLSRRASTVSPSSPVLLLQCTIFKKTNTSSARIVVNAKSVPMLTSKHFWPRPVYTRAWNFEKYNDAEGKTEETMAKDASSAGANAEPPQDQ